MAKSTVPPHRLSPASKAMVRKLLAFIKKHDNFLVSGHVRSDGDALGSQLAFHHLLKKLGKKSQVVCDQGALNDAADERPPGRTAGLPGAHGALANDELARLTADHHRKRAW